MKYNVNIYRDENGVPHIEAEDQVGVYWGMGYVHGKDRGLQMLLMRILGDGRLSELLDSSDSSLEIDKFFRKMNWAGEIEEELTKLTEFEHNIMDAYCDGSNTAFTEKTPWEFKLMGYKPEPWQKKDIVLISRMAGYLTLSQSQDEIEKLLVEMIQEGVTKEMLNELFPDILGEMDIALLKKVKLAERFVPKSVIWDIAIPRMMASNNWVISGNKTANKKPLFANDPHLEVNRIPNVWCEIVAKIKDDYIIGATMPGTSAFIIGRNNNLSWGATYAFMDSIDSWVEDCKDGKYKRGNEYKKFKTRTEIIKRKKKQDVKITFYENEHGVLDGNPNETGFYLATKWSAAKSGVITVRNFIKMWDASTVEEGMEFLGQVESFWSWVLADNNGNIGFQMSGLMPKRRDGISGFVPIPGWIKENDWQGMHSYKDLPRVYNPEKGFFVTANQDLNKYGNVNPSTMPMGSYRADRINDILSKGNNFTKEDVFKMHFDVYSIQAELFMKILNPLLPKTSQGEILKNWDYKYNQDSEAAYLFEEFYKALYKEVFGKEGMGENVIDYMASETGVFIDFYQNFDKILLSKGSIWFNGITQEELFKKVAETSLKISPKRWGDTRKVIFKNILFDEKLPKILGFDKGPFSLKGGRATIHQGQIYKSANRLTTFSPSFRTVTDFEKNETYTTIAGGPSDRRFSKWYSSGLEDWYNGNYKTIKAESNIKNKI